MKKFINSIPWLPLIFIAVFLGLAPFNPEPHLVEKFKMLLNGTLTKPIDIFDFLMHATPILLIFLKLYFSKKDA